MNATTIRTNPVIVSFGRFKMVEMRSRIMNYLGRAMECSVSTKWPNDPKLSHAGSNDVNREAELKAPSRVACSDLLGVMVNDSR
jgi:hypothetical protein